MVRFSLLIAIIALLAAAVHGQDGSGEAFGPGDVPTVNTENGVIILSARDINMKTEDLSTSLNALVARIKSLEDELHLTKNELSLTKQELDLKTLAIEMKMEQNMNETSERFDDVKTMLNVTASDLVDHIDAVEAATDTRIGVLEQNTVTKIDDAKSAAKADLANAVEKIGVTIDGVNKNVDDVKKSAQDAHTELNLIEKPVKLEIQSRGACVGNKVEYWINGKQGAAKAGRGIHVITMKEDLSSAEKYDVYDTHGSATQVNNMIKYLQSLKDGRVVLFGIRDEAISRLTDALKFEIGKFGSKFMSMGHVGYRESWAMIGIKGTPPGYAIEDDGGDARSTTCYGNAPTSKLAQEFPAGKIKWIHNDARQKISNLPSLATFRSIITSSTSSSGTKWADGRSWDFYKYSDSTVLKIIWTDNFRCYNRRYGYGRGSYCWWQIYVDGQLCSNDNYEKTSDAYNRLHAEGNTHRTNTITYYCHQLANKRYITAGKHNIRVRINNWGNDWDAYLGWASRGAIEIKEIF